VAELAAQLSSDSAYYGFVRTTEQVDKTTNVKFCFITFLGDGVGPMKKGKITTFKGTITEAFEPFHVELLNATSAAEVTDAAIQFELNSTTGVVRDAVADGHMRVGQKTIQVTQHKAEGGVRARADSLKSMTPRGETANTGYESARQTAVVPEAVKAAISAVRRDDEPTTWCVLGYDDGKQPNLMVVASGEGSADAMHAHLQPAVVLYALVRVSKQVDRSTTVKFALVSWVGEEVAPMRKAKLSTLRGAATEVLSPFHTELLNVSEPTAVTHDAIMALLEKAN